MIDGLTEEQVRLQVNPGKWSIFENIVHLQSYQHIFINRVQQILKGDNPLFERYTADLDPQFLDNCHKTFREIMHDFIGIRREISGGLLTLPESDHYKTGVHPAFGQLSLVQWINFFVLHEAHHLFTIFRLAASLKSESSQQE